MTPPRFYISRDRVCVSRRGGFRAIAVTCVCLLYHCSSVGSVFVRDGGRFGELGNLVHPFKGQRIVQGFAGFN